MKRRPILTLIAALFTLLLTAIPAQAMQPTQFTFDDVVMVDPWVSCDGFSAREESLYRTTITRFYTNDGTLDRVQVDAHMLEGKLINNSNPDKWIAFGPSNYHWFLKPEYLPDGSFAIGRLVGLTQKIMLPDGGILSVDAGMGSFDLNTNTITFHGRSSDSEVVNQTVCSLLR